MYIIYIVYIYRKLEIMKTNKYDAVKTVNTKYGDTMEVGSYFEEYECEATGMKLIKESPVGLMKLTGIKRTVILPTGETENFMTEKTFEIFKKLMK